MKTLLSTPSMILSLALSALTASSALAGDNHCVPKKIFVQTQAVDLSEDCVLSFPGYGDNDYGRSYIDHDGVLFVFAQVANTGSVSKDFGSRTYYLLPVRQKSDFEFNDETGELIIHHSSGETMTLAKDLKVKSFTGVDFTEELKSSDANKGGLELKTYSNGVILDTGWTHSPITIQSQNKSTFIDRTGAKCVVGNKEIFDFSVRNPDDSPNPVFRFPQQEELKRFLKTRCPKLDLSPLAETFPAKE
jgi:hypothetical protein